MKQLKSLAGYRIGDRVENKQFPKGIDSRFFTTQITGRIEKLFETKDAGWATIRQDDGKVRLVCLG